jgi:cytochrome c553
MKRAWLLLSVLVALAGCGGDEGTGGGGGAQANADGKRVFESAGCSGCHTLADANAKGTVGPDLDQLRPTQDAVKTQVERGGNGMPAFGGKLSDAQITAVAAYVSQAAAKSGTSGPSGVSFKRDDTQLSECHGANDEPCYEQAFGNLVYDGGPSKALATLGRTMRADKTVGLACHRIAHRMGAAALQLYDEDVGLAFSKGDAVCSSGYYHGILERAFAGVPQDKLAATAQKLCSSGTIARNGFLRFQCNHGLGHGLMLTTHYEMPLALDTCDSLHGDYDVEACQGGVFMENFTSSYGFVSGYLKDDDLLYPCDIVSEPRKPACYLIVTSRVLPAVHWNWKKAADVCRGAEPNWVYMCFRSYGRDAISTNAYRQPVARRLCHYATDFEGECVLSVALHIVNEERGVQGAARWCRDTPTSLQADCYAGIWSPAALLYPDPARLQRVCDRLTPDPRLRFACATGQRPAA